MVSPQTVLKALPPLFESKDAKARENVKATVVSASLPLLTLDAFIYGLKMCAIGANLTFEEPYRSYKCIYGLLQGICTEALSAMFSSNTPL